LVVGHESTVLYSSQCLDAPKYKQIMICLVHVTHKRLVWGLDVGLMSVYTPVMLVIMNTMPS
jgi:hypothetical protein